MGTDKEERLPLRTIFMGTPAFAVPALDALLDANCDIIGVYTQPDRRSGRGRRLTAPPVKQAAIERGLPIFQPASLRRNEEARLHITSLAPDLIAVVAYGLFLPSHTLGTPPLGALNVHPSLLPRHRGPSPVATAILEGNKSTGVTLMQLDEGMDSGPIIAQRRTPIGADETAEDLTDRLFDIGADLLADTINPWRDGNITPVPQSEADATTSRLLKREDGAIDWTQSAGQIARQIRAYYPWPSSFTQWQGRQLKVHEASALDGIESELPGTVTQLPQGIAVTTGSGALLLRRVQIEGRQATNISDFARGYRDFVGSLLGTS
jgi:methionyl-tRNA formyltransferase